MFEIAFDINHQLLITFQMAGRNCAMSVLAVVTVILKRDIRGDQLTIGKGESSRRVEENFS